MIKGIIDLQAYNAKNSFERVKRLYYLYDRLYTYNFYDFEYLQLSTSYGKRSHYENIKLLIDQGFIELIDGNFEVNNDEEIAVALAQLDTKYRAHIDIEHDYIKKVAEYAQEKVSEFEFDNVFQKMSNSSTNVLSLKERLFSVIQSKRDNDLFQPTLSSNCFDGLELDNKKALIYKVLINNIPMPDTSIPLIDIIQYKNEHSSQLRFKRLKSWVNKFAQTNFSEQEIIEEIEYLIEEYKNEMKILGLKSNLMKIEFCIKVLPHIFEKLLKLQFSQLIDPFFKLKYEKVSLLKDELKAKGNELAFIANLK